VKAAVAVSLPMPSGIPSLARGTHVHHRVEPNLCGLRFEQAFFVRNGDIYTRARLLVIVRQLFILASNTPVWTCPRHWRTAFSYSKEWTTTEDGMQ